jgi:nucleotide-binding universal stress UspA family protein
MAATIEANFTTMPAKRSAVTRAPYPVPVKRILVPTDLSAASLKGVAYAVKIARHFDAELTILHVFRHPPPLGSVTGGYYLADDFDHSRRETRRKLTAILEDVGGGQAKANSCILFGRPATEIAATAEAINSDLIVICAHHYNWLQRVFSGSESERIVRAAPCPVLVVHQNEHDFIPDLNCSE